MRSFAISCALGVALGLELFGFGYGGAALRVQLAKLRDVQREPARGQALGHRVEVVPEKRQVVHTVALTCACTLWYAKRYRSEIGTQGWPTGLPVYSARGRIRRLLRNCSSTCAVHPDMRLTAKIGVNRSIGMPSE